MTQMIWTTEIVEDKNLCQGYIDNIYGYMTILHCQYCVTAVILTPTITWGLGCHNLSPSQVWYKWIYLIDAIPIKRYLGV